MFQLISRGPKGPPIYFLHGPAHLIRLLWFPILGLIGPYVMRPLFAFNCISSQVAFPEEPPRPKFFLTSSWLPSWKSGRWFPLIPFNPLLSPSLPGTRPKKGLLAGGISQYFSGPNRAL